MIAMELHEFIQHMDKVQETYPREAEKTLRRGARQMVGHLKEESPDSGKPHKRKIKDSWKMEMAGATAAGLRANIRSTSPHYHLVERGHVQKTRTGKIVGYVQGRYFTEKIANRYADEIMEDMGERLYKEVDGKLRQ